MFISMMPFLCRQPGLWNGGWQPLGKVAIIVRTPSSRPMVSDLPPYPCRCVFDLNVPQGATVDLGREAVLFV